MKKLTYIAIGAFVLGCVAWAFGWLEFGIGLVAISPICAALDGDIEPDCDFPIQGGVDDLLYLINKADIASVTRDTTNPQIIEDIILVSGARAFRVQGQNNSNNTRWELVKQRYTRMYNHIVSFVGFDLGPSGYERYEELSNALVVAVVVNNYRGTNGNAAIKIYGLDAGLRASTMSQDMSSADTQGAVQIEMASDEINKEPHTPATLFDTNFATSLAIIEGLV